MRSPNAKAPLPSPDFPLSENEFTGILSWVCREKYGQETLSPSLDICEKIAKVSEVLACSPSGFCFSGQIGLKVKQEVKALTSVS